MKKIGLTLMGVIIGFAAIAQRQIGKVDQLSDQQIIQLWTQGQRGGMSESDVIKELVKRGLSTTEVDMFKKRLVKLQGSNKTSFSKEALIKDTSFFVRDSSWIIDLPDVRIKSPYYGFDFFSNAQSNFTPNMNMATPAN